MTMDFAESGPFWLSPQAEPTTETPGQRARRFERGALPYLGQADSPAGDWPTPGLGRRVPTMQAVPASLARRTPGLALTLGPATARRTADGCPPASTPSRCPVFDHHRSGALDRTGLPAAAELATMGAGYGAYSQVRLAIRVGHRVAVAHAPSCGGLSGGCASTSSPTSITSSRHILCWPRRPATTTGCCIPGHPASAGLAVPI